MALTINVDGNDLAFGLNWASAPTGRSRAGSVADLGVRFKASHKLFLEEQQQYGFLEAGGRLQGRSKKGVALSGAALFATMVPANQDSILILTLEEKKKALIIAIADGRIYQDVVVSLGNGLEKSDSGDMLPDGNFALPEDSGRARVKEKVDQIYNETGKDFAPYGNAFFVFAESQAMSVEELLEGDRSRASLSKFVDPRPTIKLAVGVLVLAGLFWGYGQYKEAERKRKELEALQSQVDPMDLYRENIRTTLAQAKFTAANAEQALRAPAFNREQELGGWLLIKVECSNAGVCQERWINRNGTSRSFAEANKISGEVLKYSDDLRTLDFGYKVPVQVSALLPDALPQLSDFKQRWVAAAEDLAVYQVSVQASLDPSIDFGLPGGVTASMVPPGAGVARADVTLAGQVGLASEVLGRLPDNLMVSSIEAKFGDKIDSHTFTIKGFYYVQK